ncbi:hypothetical protein B0H63DRAFT_539533 [Podospora didyma]|uniref:Uncharacterized protein n=1 Tax=Podospora didyma TaxID=330526 RepID=A0AAE0P0B8_9PEZI|nr:hypothetical protein B0H63DRAFT_539533 [Podospora didyma]
MADSRTLGELATRVSKLGRGNVSITILNTSNSSGSSNATLSQLLAVLASLRSSEACSEEGITADDNDDENVAAASSELGRAVVRVIEPVGTVTAVPESDRGLWLDQNDRTKTYNQVTQHCSAVADTGIQILETLSNKQHQIIPPGKLRRRFDDDILLALVGFTDSTHDDWATAALSVRAASLLRSQLSDDEATKSKFIVEAILQHYLRPLFSKSKPSSVTASGRKAEYVDRSSTHHRPEDESHETKPWKYVDFRAIPAVSWAVHEADENLIAQHWPLFIPVLMTLVDDSTTSIRQRGLLALTQFLAKFPSKTLRDTGLGKVFEETIFPTLSYLPSITPEAESLLLLPPAYSALLCLASKQQQQPSPQKTKLLDKLLREGIFTGYFYAKAHVRIVEVLCQQAALVIGQMGIHAVKHLKDLIPMISSIMIDPFAPACPATLVSAIQALQAILANCWPRIASSGGGPWQDEIINALVLCWLNWHEEKEEEPPKNSRGSSSDAAAAAMVEQELVKSARALAGILKREAAATTARGDDDSGDESSDESGDGDLNKRVAPLVEKEPSLRRLFFSP